MRSISTSRSAKTSAANRWPGAEHWQKRADPGLTREELLKRSEAVVVGIDGGGLDDLFGLNILGREKSSIPPWTTPILCKPC
jgi:phage terminase large subunit-like protein